MFLEYYKLNDQPFGVTPDPGFLFLSPTHREALASLSYGVTAGRGFVALIAQPGMGKTTLLFKLLQQLETSARTVFIFQTQCSPRDFLRNLLVDLGVNDSDGDLVRIQSELNKVLLRESHAGKRFVLVIDEAQNLDPSVLELVRMLSNFETPRQKLMNIVLAGQPQLAETLNSPDLVQLRQRVSIIARLNAFTDEETRLYIDHRLRVAGYDCQHPLFTERALAMIASFSEGIPRNINNICFNALSLGRALKQRTIDSDVVREVLDDLDLGSLHRDAAINQRRTEMFVKKVRQALWVLRDNVFAVLGFVVSAAAAVYVAAPRFEIAYGTSDAVWFSEMFFAIGSPIFLLLALRRLLSWRGGCSREHAWGGKRASAAARLWARASVRYKNWFLPAGPRLAGGPR